MAVAARRHNACPFGLALPVTAVGGWLAPGKVHCCASGGLVDTRTVYLVILLLEVCTHTLDVVGLVAYGRYVGFRRTQAVPFGATYTVRIH